MVSKMTRFVIKMGRIVLWLIVVFVVFSLCQVTLYKWINPTLTPLMVRRTIEAHKAEKTFHLQKQWVDLEDMSTELPRAVIASEDNLFIEHKGFSHRGLKNALEEKKTKGRVIHGGSTISQQTAKNVFTSGKSTYVRKAFEFYYTFLIEKIWGKKRIMEVYLNVAEMGDGVFGVEAACQTFYHHSAKKVSRPEAARIAACLPNPRKMHIGKPSAYVMKRQGQIVSLMGKIGRYGKVE